MGIVFVMFAELWVTFFRHVQNYGSKFFNQNGTSPSKIRLSLPPPPPCAVGCCAVSRCIVLEVRSAVADESANELYNCNYL